jgi:nucleoside-diphosphate kinase
LHKYVLMTEDKTLTIIKPLAVKEGHIGKIIDRIIQEGFTVCALKMHYLCKREAQQFYAVHEGKDFFDSLTDYMSSGPVIVAILQKKNAVKDYRKLIGATNPEDAAPNTLRKLFGSNVRQNAVHGSDSNENALLESRFFFSELEEMQFISPSGQVD